MHAELQGIWYGLKLAKDRRVDRIIIKADSSSALQFLDDAYDPLHPCAPVVFDLKALIDTFTEVKWMHTFREANRCADVLADHGHHLSWGVVTFDQVPPFLSLACFDDLSGTLFERVA